MGMVQSIGTASDPIMATLAAGLEIQFGSGAGDALAHHFLAAEQCDFLWDARVEERWLGAYVGFGEDAEEFERIAIWGQLDGHWYMGILLVDGEGMPHGTIAHQVCGSPESARQAMADAR